MELRFASQSGTSAEAAEDVYHEMLDRGFNVSLQPLGLEDVERWISDAAPRFVVFFVSTTGQGEWPTGARPFWRRLLRRECPKLAGLRFAIFGFGDSAYTEFNFAARRLESRLLQLGAQRFVRTGLGDDRHDFGYTQEFDPWFEDLILAAEGTAERARGPVDELVHLHFQVTHLPSAPSRATSQTDEPDRGRNATSPAASPARGRNATSPTASPARGRNATSPAASPARGRNATVKNNVRLTAAEHFQAVHHLSLRVDRSWARTWVPGDVCAVFPRTPAALVARFLRCQHMLPDTRVIVRRAPVTHGALASPPSPFPEEPISLEVLFSEYLDITACPRGRRCFKVLAECTEDELRRGKLEEFGGKSVDAKKALYEYCLRPRRSLLEVLEDFPTTKVPLSTLVNVIPLMAAREYSIATACYFRRNTAADDCTWADRIRTAMRARCSGGEDLCMGDVELCVAVVEVERGPRRIRGLCSTYLAQLRPGDRLCVEIRRGVSDLRAAVGEKPVICISPGTGLSPIRALLRTRALSEDLIFLGFRNRAKDFLFEEEWREAAGRVIVAFSRDDPEAKVYVQDKIEEHGAAVCEALDRGAVVVISGRSHPMPQQVRGALLDVLCERKTVERTAAEKFLASLKRENRYLCDTWA